METKIDGKDVLVLSDSDMKKVQEIEEQITYHEEQAKKLDADGKDAEATIEKLKVARANCEKSIIIKGKDALSDVFDNFEHMIIICYLARRLVDDAKMSDIKALKESIIIETINMAIKAGIDVNAQISGKTFFNYANTPKITKLLIDAGANVNAKDEDGKTALMRAKTAEETKLLIAAGADVNAKDKDGNTALMNAKTEEEAQLLIDAGADINDGALSTALKKQPIEKVRFLIHAGARVDVDLLKELLLNPTLVLRWTKEKVKLIVDLFIKSGGNINEQDKEGNTLLMIAASKGPVAHEELAKYLIEMGADVNAKNKFGTTALMRTYSLNIAQRLVHAGADVNAKREGGYTALMDAVADFKGPDFIKFLLDHGADVNAKDRSNRTVLDYMKTLHNEYYDEHSNNRGPEIEKLLHEAENEPISKKLERAKIQTKNAETKKRIKEKLKTATKRLSGVVVADKMAEMIRAGEIQTPITPEKGKKLRKQIIEDRIKGRK